MWDIACANGTNKYHRSLGCLSWATNAVKGRYPKPQILQKHSGVAYEWRAGSNLLHAVLRESTRPGCCGYFVLFDSAARFPYTVYAYYSPSAHALQHPSGTLFSSKALLTRCRVHALCTHLTRDILPGRKGGGMRRILRYWSLWWIHIVHGGTCS